MKANVFALLVILISLNPHSETTHVSNKQAFTCYEDILLVAFNWCVCDGTLI